MNYKVNLHRVKDIRKKSPSIKSNKGLTLKRLFLITIILLSFLLTPNANFKGEIIDKIDNNQLIKKENLKTSNPGENFFKFTYGTSLSHGNWILDPQDAWDYTDAIVIDQVCEGLFHYNLSDPSMTPVPNLANGTGTWSSDNLNYTISLINNATFHDGTIFNATAVKFSFDRLAYFMNSTGKMTWNNITSVNSLYRWPDSVPIINSTEIINETAIKFVLNRPFAGLPGLLGIPASYIVSNISTNPTKYINSTIGDLVGTGPFVYDGYTPYEEVRFHAYDNYWRGKAQIELLRYKIVSDKDQALLSGEVDLISTPYNRSILEADPNINVIENWSSAFYYLGMNNKLLNKTWRQAFSYAINYSYIIENITSTPSKRARSPLPDCVIYSNTTNNVATFNVTKAREIMQSMGFGITLNTSYPGTNDTQWQSSEFIRDEFGQDLDLNLLVDYWGVPYQGFQLINNLLKDNLPKIGCGNLTETERKFEQLYGNGTITPDNLGLWLMGWGPDFNDPYSNINSLYSNSSIGSINYGQVNDTTLQNLMDNAMNETDPTARKIIYNNIQKNLVEDLMPMAFLSTPRTYDAYFDYVEGFKSNPFEQIKFYGVSQNSTLDPGKIYIDGNQEWNIFKNMAKCTGLGTSSDPYVIKDLVIDGQGRSRSCIIIEDSDVHFVIENCNVFNSLGAGIELINVNNSQITESDCSNNDYGIILEGANNSIIFNNIFASNVINAIDNGSSNSWDNGIIGNSWDDYVGSDANDNGIGDTPYFISGTAGSQDNYPQWWDGDNNPIISLIAPQDNYLFGKTAPNYQISPFAADKDQIWYTLNDSLTSFTVKNVTNYNSIIDQTLWDAFSNGTITIRFSINDTSGKVGYDEVVVRKDIVAPIIIVNSPYMNQYFTTDPPDFNISINEPNLESTWYTIDGGTTNFTFSGLTGTINQTLWDNIQNGTIIITFYANDSGGNIGFADITIRKNIDFHILEPIIIDDTGGGNYTWDDAVNAGWCTGSGTQDDPYVVELLEIDGQNSESCLIIRNSSVFVIIESSIFFNAGGGINEAGLKLEDVSNVILNNINCSNNNGSGILLFNCQNITITNSTLNHNEFAGIFLNQSSFNFIVNNTETINYNFWGIYLLLSHNNSILGNSIGYNIIGLYFNNSNFNDILNNIFKLNQEGIVIDDNSQGNHIEGNTIITKTEFPTMIVVVSIIGGIIGISGASTAIILRKKVFIPKPGKEVKVFGKKKTKIETKLKERLSFVDHLIRENQIKDAIKNLNEIQDLSKTYGLIEILNECEEQLTYCNKLYSEIIDKIRKNVLDISTKFARLQIIDISEKTEIPDEDLIISVIQEMIQNNEIFGEYFSSSQAIAFDQQKNLEKQGKLVSIYAKVKPEEEKEYNVFLSYSTIDSEHFDMARIVISLENYPDIGRVLYWEADSKQNIVEFMDETLKKCNVFILFCSENSIKSAAVKDEWQAAFQRRKKELLKFIPVYEKEEQIPPILGHLLNVKFEKEDFNSFIEKLHQEIQR